MPEVITFETTDDMIAWVREARAQHDRASKALDIPTMIHGNAWFIRVEDGLTIIGRKLTVCTKSRGLTIAEWEEDLHHTREQEALGYIFGQWFSVACPEGEYGSAPGECCAPITKEGFDAVLATIQGGSNG